MALENGPGAPVVQAEDRQRRHQGGVVMGVNLPWLAPAVTSIFLSSSSEMGTRVLVGGERKVHKDVQRPCTYVHVCVCVRVCIY